MGRHAETPTPRRVPQGSGAAGDTGAGIDRHQPSARQRQKSPQDVCHGAKELWGGGKKKLIYFPKDYSDREKEDKKDLFALPPELAFLYFVSAYFSEKAGRSRARAD